MLPYTTYHIPEWEKNQTGLEGKWLWMIIPGPNSDEEQELLRKISAALKADYEQNVFFIYTNEPFTLGDFKGVHPQLIISFGSPPEQIGLWIDMIKPGMRVLEQFTFILTLTPDTLSKTAAAKKELWGWMQAYLELQTP